MYIDEESGTQAVDAADAPNQPPCAEDDVASPQSKRSPAFQFYPEAWFSSSKVHRMSHTERGIYVDLLAHCWLDNGLPTNVKVLAAMLRIPATRFERLWTNGALHECFVERNGKLHNTRLDAERKKQRDFRERQRNAAAMRWHSDGTPTAMLSVSNSVSISKKKQKEEDPTPIVLTFPVSGDPEHPLWPLRQGRIDGWKAAYPQLDIALECRKALAWIEANGPKTARGMPAFLVRWLNNAVNRGPRPVSLAATGTAGRGRTGAPPAGKYDGIEEA